MKKLLIISLVSGMVFLFSSAAFGLYTPGVAERRGVVTVRNIDDFGWVIGGEFGLADDLALIADIGENDFERAGIKFQLNPGLSLLGGVIDTKAFLGINFGGSFTENITGLGEIDVYQLINDRLAFDYELGIKLRLSPNLDLRGGLFGTVTEDRTDKHFQFGLGYEF